MDGCTITPVFSYIQHPSGSAAPIGLDWVCLDIETTNGRPEEVERHMRLHWSPSPKWKPETIGARWLDALAKKQERAALLDESPILQVTLCTSSGELRCIHCMEAHPARQQDGGLVEGYDNAQGMLLALRNLLDTHCDVNTCLVGHNVKSFDLKRLRWFYVHERVRPPAVFANPTQPVYDTMKEYGYRFSLVDKPFCALDDLLELFGIESHKGTVSGADVPELYERGEFGTLITYGLLDALKEAELFLRMTGNAEGLL